MSILKEGFDADEARYNRMNRTQPASFQPGQEPSFNSGDTFFNNTSSPANNPFGGQANPIGGQDNPFGGQGNQFGGQGFPSGQGNPNPFAGSPVQPNFGQPQNQGMSDEERFYNAMKVGAKGTTTFAKDVISSFSEATPLYYMGYGYKSAIVGLVAFALGLILLLVAHSSFGVSCMIGGLVASAIGVVIWMFNVEDAKNCDSEYKETEPEPTQPEQNTFDSNSFSQTPSFADEEESFGGGDDDEDEDTLEDDEDEDEDDFMSEFDIEPVKGEDTETALSNLQDIPKGMYTRQYLYDAFIRRLPKLKPSFDKIKEYDSDDDEFLAWEEFLQEAAEVGGCSEDYLPTLSNLKVSLFSVILECDRPKGFKSDTVADELCNMYSDSEGIEREKVSANVVNIGMRCRITIKNGKTALIGLRDMMEEENTRKFFLDTNHYMPIVIGVNEYGKVIVADFKKVESVLITGMPRSGKSWFVQATLTQMCGFLSPSELNFYICDPKGDISDFKQFSSIPHVKHFAKSDEDILRVLDWIVSKEAPRRKRLIGDNGNVNIWDYKEANPNVELPLIYVVIDEVVTLAERMDKDTKARFQGMLTVLVSQLPALGIRIFMIPHVIKNDIIAKTTTDLIQCRISVMGSPDHIESTTGTKPREFNIRLSNVGDMAVRMPTVQAHTFFSHGAAITDSNVENNNFFDYLTKLWDKLEGIEPKQEVTSTNENHIQINPTGINDSNSTDSYNPLGDDDDIEFDFKSSILQ